MSAKLLGNGAYALGLSVWVVVALMLGQSLTALVLLIPAFDMNPAIQTTILAALGYALGLAIAIGVPVLLTKKPITKKTLGIDRLPSWSDIGLSILAVLPYYIFAAALIWFGTDVLKLINPETGQQIPFTNLGLRIEYFVAFVTLVVLAPLAEELLFRGYFLGRLGARVGKWVAVPVTAVVFALLHLPGFTDAGIVLQWGATFDTFALGLVAGSLRQVTGSIWTGVILHAIKNGIAFYYLFIAPLSGGN